MAAPDNTAVRVALWRAQHVELDAAPHVLDDVIGLQLVAPEPGWQQRPDMHPERTRRNRASIVGRARFVDDLVEELAALGVDQYVILGAGLDTFAQRRPELVSRLRVFELDEPVTQAWKRERLASLGYDTSSAHFVPVDFESDGSWIDRLVAAGFDRARPAVVVSLGVAVYLERAAVEATLRESATLAAGSTLVMSFMVPLAMVDDDEQMALQGAARGAQASGTPWVSFFTPDELVGLARAAGFRDVRHVSPAELTSRYFAGRSDGLRPSSAEALIVASK